MGAQAPPGFESQPRRLLAAAATVLVAAIGLSRIYLGVHDLSDVLAGYSAVLALLLLAIGGMRICSRVDLNSAIGIPGEGARADVLPSRRCERR